MNKYTLLVIFIFFSILLFGQNQKKIDSLKFELSNSENNLNKFQILNHLWNISINNDIDASDIYANSMIDLGKQLEIDSILSFGYERKAVGFAYRNTFDSSKVYFNKALKMYQESNDYKKMAGVQRNLGQDLNVIGKLDSAYYFYDQSGKNYELAKDSSGIASIYNSKAIVYLQKGYYNLSLENALNSTAILEKLNEPIELNQNYMVIATIYSNMKDTLNAIKYYEKLNTFFENQNLKRQLCSNLMLTTRLLVTRKDLKEKTEAQIIKAINIAKELKDTGVELEANGIYADLLYHSGDYEKAENILNEITNNTIFNIEDYDKTSIYPLLGKTHLALNNYEKAILYLNEAKLVSEQLGILSSLLEINKYLSLAYQQKSDNKKALYYFKEYKVLNDSIYNSESQNRFNELQTIYETEKKNTALLLKEEEIKILNIKAKNDQLTKKLYGIGMFSFLTISALLYFGFKQRIKKNKVEREKQEEIYKQEIEFKQKELASQTLHLVQKNTFLQELKENLEKIKQSPELFKVEFRRIVMLLKKQSAEDKDWEVFKSYFSEVHNDFDNKLKALAKDISEKEIRLASFLRMNLSTKEIASMLNVLPDSVLKSKYRLKKKFGLDKEQDLNEYLNTL